MTDIAKRFYYTIKGDKQDGYSLNVYYYVVNPDTGKEYGHVTSYWLTPRHHATMRELLLELASIEEID